MAFKNYRLVLLVLLLSLSALAQQPFSPPSPRVRTFDAQHYIINSRLDFAKKKIIGQTTVRLKPLAGNFSGFELDAAEMKIESVELETAAEARPLQFKAVQEKIAITLDRAYAANETLSVRVKYTITDPDKGAHFVAEEREKDGALINPRQAWTQGEADEARYWFPGYDYPDDKATSEQFITVPSGDMAVGNGEFIGATENIDGTKTFHYKMPVPHSTYLISFVAGNYVRVDGKYGNVALGYYLYPGTEDLAVSAFGKTPKMIAVFEKTTGVIFPYNKYDQTIVAEFAFGGMENITATTLADKEILAARLEVRRFFTDDLVSHELAHSWFGDMVTCKTWHQLWLNEGFATFMEAVFKESESGRQMYLDKVRADAAVYFADDSIDTDRRHALVNRYAKADDDLFDGTTYRKGGVVIYMLREELGDAAFWKGVNIYLTRHKFASVETADLQAAMEEASGKKLDWFFNQWIYGAGHPQLRIKSSYDETKKEVALDIEQVQKSRSDMVAAFRLAVEVEIVTGNSSVKKTIDITKTKEVFTFPAAAKPDKVLFDKNDRAMLKRIRFSGTVMVESMTWLK